MSHQVKVRNLIQNEYLIKYLSCWYDLIYFIHTSLDCFQDQELSEDKKIQ